MLVSDVLLPGPDRARVADPAANDGGAQRAGEAERDLEDDEVVVDGDPRPHPGAAMWA